MALHFNKYLNCPKCLGYKMTLIDLMYIEETDRSYNVKKTKAIQCIKCNNIIKTINKFEDKPFIEVD